MILKLHHNLIENVLWVCSTSLLVLLILSSVSALSFDVSL